MNNTEVDKVLNDAYDNATSRNIKVTYPQERTAYRVVDDKVTLRWDTPVVKETKNYRVYSTKNGYYIQKLKPQKGNFPSLLTSDIKRLSW